MTATRAVTLDDIEHFARFAGDNCYAHIDEAAARANPFFDVRVAHGYLIVSFAAGIFVDADPGPVLANYGVDRSLMILKSGMSTGLGDATTRRHLSPSAAIVHPAALARASDSLRS